MPLPPPPGVIPLRPLTLGELLDTAVALLRRGATPLLLAGAVLGVAEQAALRPLRTAADVSVPGYLPHSDRLGQYWVLLAAGLAAEAVAIALLGGLAGHVATADLLGERPTPRQLLSLGGSRWFAVTVVALITGLVVGICALAGLLPWIFGYGLAGLAVPAVVIERRGPGGALLRSLALSVRAGLRAAAFRLVGYGAWLAVRVTLALGGPLVLYQFFGLRPWLPWAAMAIAAGVNAVAYPALACVDAVLYVEARIRTEGLDIWLGRALRRDAGSRPDLSRVAP
ncbi:hypothetical protein HC031_17735 [Planosporangium thailandense]|uniref:Glycerophosphoryl diester phosphodiesterase membrane domain-containing protein n=1 Tax=Planosporangium thailandense TaxID=765197 RepID=A0ABX0Y0F0_9ACTN|nr:hypothetical protein [Planosporangium thailandense]NJC71546.1 hypothetical protein [Planosporangium thailandense]